MTDFSVTPSSLSLLGSAEPKIPWDEDSMDLGGRCACWNLRNFTDVNWCNLAL